MGKNKTKSSAVSNALSKDQITLKRAITHYSPRGVTDEQIKKMSPFHKKGDTLFFGTVEGNCVLILQIAKDNYVGKKLSLKRLVNASGTNDITILCDAIYRMSGTKISQKEALKIKPFYKLSKRISKLLQIVTLIFCLLIEYFIGIFSSFEGFLPAVKLIWVVVLSTILRKEAI